MKEVVLVFIGGGTGSLLRYFFGRWFNPLFEQFFMGTFLANLISCLILGFVATLILSKTVAEENLRPLIMIGLCGGFSTFSTFSFEVFSLFKGDQYGPAALYILGSLVVCVAGILAGAYLSRWVI